MQNVFASRTLIGLRQLINYVEPNVLSRVWFILLASILSGFLDFAAVAAIGRLTGSLVGSDLENLLPGIKVFGASVYEQSWNFRQYHGINHGLLINLRGINIALNEIFFI